MIYHETQHDSSLAGLFLFFIFPKINPGSKAAIAHICTGDTVERINDKPTKDLDQNDAQNLIRNAATSLELVLSK